MAGVILRNVRAFAGAVDLTGVNNKLELGAEVEEKDVTTWGSYDAASDSVWKEILGGIKSGKITAEGLWEAGAGSVDEQTWADLGGTGPWTICPHTAGAGALAYLTKATRSNYKLLGAVGDAAPWAADASGSWPISRGLVLHPPGTARTTTGSATGVQYVAAGAGQYVYATLHILSAAGTTPSLTVKVQSDVDNTFATPLDVITFSAATARGSQVARAAGPNADTWYRVTWTISGTSPSFLFLAAVGISS